MADAGAWSGATNPQMSHTLGRHADDGGLDLLLSTGIVGDPDRDGLADGRLRVREAQVLQVGRGEEELVRRAGVVQLRAGNPTFPPILFRDGQTMTICGVVTATIKRFK